MAGGSGRHGGGRALEAQGTLPSPPDVERLICELASQKQIKDKDVEEICQAITWRFPNITFNTDCKTDVESVWDAAVAKCPQAAMKEAMEEAMEEDEPVAPGSEEGCPGVFTLQSESTLARIEMGEYQRTHDVGGLPAYQRKQSGSAKAPFVYFYQEFSNWRVGYDYHKPEAVLTSGQTSAQCPSDVEKWYDWKDDRWGEVSDMTLTSPSSPSTSSPAALASDGVDSWVVQIAVPCALVCCALLAVVIGTVLKRGGRGKSEPKAHEKVFLVPEKPQLEGADERFEVLMLAGGPVVALGSPTGLRTAEAEAALGSSTWTWLGSPAALGT